MRDHSASVTAEIVAAMRAYHSIVESPKVFDDPFAFDFCNRRWQRILKSPLRRAYVFNLLMRQSKPVALEVLGRARYTEDLLDQAIANGCAQYVILGAGFDSFALRRPDLIDVVQVYEIDFPATQKAKREKILANYDELPKNLNFVSVDFTSESLIDGLKRSSFDFEQEAFFSWLGTTMYLTREISMETLGLITEHCKPGSEIVFDYIVSPSLKKVMEQPPAEKISKAVAKLGEPFLGFYQAEEMGGLLSSAGMQLIENLNPVDQQRRYHQGRRDRVKTSSRAYFAHARVPVKS